MNPDSLPSFDEWHAKADRLKKCVDYATSGGEEMSFRLQLSAHLALAAHPAAPQGAQPVRASDEQVTEWAARNDLGGTLCEWRAICEDAQTLLAASPADAAPVVPQEVRMLTDDEAAPILDDIIGNYPSDLAERIVRKAFEVNAGLTIPAKEQPK